MFNPIAFQSNQHNNRYLNSLKNDKLLKGTEISRLFHFPKAIFISAQHFFAQKIILKVLPNLI